MARERVWTIRFLDGPCRGLQRPYHAVTVPQRLTCNDVIYTYSLPRSEGAIWVYVVEGGPNDSWTVEQVRGRRDVFVAFRRLMRVMAKDAPKQLRKVHGAGRRIRRAVR